MTASNENGSIVGETAKVVAELAKFVKHRHLSLIGLKSGCEHVPLAPTYLDNLERLGLIEMPNGHRIKADEPYAEIEDHIQVKKILDLLRESETHTLEVDKIKMDLTDLGRQFIKTCVIDKAAQERS